MEDTLRSIKQLAAATFAAAALSVLLLIVAAVLGGLAFTQVYRYSSPLYPVVSGVLPPSPYVFYLNAAASPITLTLPQNLSPYVGGIYRIVSLTAQPHVIHLAQPGATWDGTSVTATFGGGIGDGIEFEVISASRIVLWSVNGVTFV